MAWSSSNRRERLPADWPKRVSATKRRAGGRCEGISLNGEPRWHAEQCPGLGRECDHDKRGDNHDLSNLRWLSTECHKRKTWAEKPVRKRRPRRHPGG